MWARLATYEMGQDQIEEGLRGFERAVDQLRDMEGARGAYLLVDRASGKAATLTLWESEEALRASDEEAARIRREAAGEAERNVERYEVALHRTFE